MAQLTEEFPEDLQFVYRHFPLPSHDKARLSAQAADAAGLQGRFWEMHDLLFERRSEWANLSVADFQDWVNTAAGELELDVEQFSQDLNSDAIVAAVEKAAEDALALGLPGTPAMVVNGQYYDGPSDYQNLSTIIRLIKLREIQYTECPPMVIDPARQYRATLATEKGDIVIELFTDEAPMAVNSFVFLARDGWFDGVTFHRVLPGVIAQTGDPTATGYGGAGYAFANEIDPDLKFDKPGVVGMANAGPDSNQSQFFITYSSQERLNGGFTIFGQVVVGMDVVERLTPRNPATGQNLPPGDRIISVIIEER